MIIFLGRPGLAGTSLPFWIFFGANGDGDGGDNWSCKMWKAAVKLSPPTNLHPTFYRPDAILVDQPTVSKRWKSKGYNKKNWKNS